MEDNKYYMTSQPRYSLENGALLESWGGMILELRRWRWMRIRSQVSKQESQNFQFCEEATIELRHRLVLRNWIRLGGTKGGKDA